MKKIISSLFCESGYIEEKMTDGKFYSYKNKDRKSFWLVVDDIVISDILDKQASLFSACQNICNDPDLDKNLSLLVLSETQTNFSTSFKKNIMDVEEDPYLFRKYVLYLSTEEVGELRIEIGLQDNVLGFLSLHLSNLITFQYYKNNPEKHSWQSLIYRIAIKLPFISTGIGEKVKMAELWKKKDEKLASKKSSGLESLESAIFDESKFDSINTMEPKNILNLLLYTQDAE